MPTAQERITAQRLDRQDKALYLAGRAAVADVLLTEGYGGDGLIVLALDCPDIPGQQDDDGVRAANGDPFYFVPQAAGFFALGAAGWAVFGALSQILERLERLEHPEHEEKAARLATPTAETAE